MAVVQRGRQTGEAAWSGAVPMSVGYAGLVAVRANPPQTRAGLSHRGSGVFSQLAGPWSEFCSAVIHMVSGGQWKAPEEPTRVASLGKPSLPLLPTGGRRSLGSVPSALASSLHRSGHFYLLTPLPFPCPVSSAGQGPRGPERCAWH